MASGKRAKNASARSSTSSRAAAHPTTSRRSSAASAPRSSTKAPTSKRPRRAWALSLAQTKQARRSWASIALLALKSTLIAWAAELRLVLRAWFVEPQQTR